MRMPETKARRIPMERWQNALPASISTLEDTLEEATEIKERAEDEVRESRDEDLETFSGDSAELGWRKFENRGLTGVAGGAGRESSSGSRSTQMIGISVVWFSL